MSYGFNVLTYRMKISLLTIFLFMSAASLTSVTARNWKVADKTWMIYWDSNCHFVGYVIAQQNSQANECGRICLEYGAGPQARPPCTHFTHANGICYLKRNTDGWKEIVEDGNTCGFIRGRSAQTRD